MWLLSSAISTFCNSTVCRSSFYIGAQRMHFSRLQRQRFDIVTNDASHSRVRHGLHIRLGLGASG